MDVRTLIAMYRAYKHNHKNKYRLSYGWRLSKLGYQMVDVEQRANIYLIYSLKKHGYTLQAICNLLNVNGIATARNGQWYPSTIKSILHDNLGIVRS